MADGQVVIDTKIDPDGARHDLNSLQSKISPQLKRIGALVATAFSVRALVDFGRQAVEMASDLQEAQNVVDTSFKEMNYKMEEFAKNSIKQFGISELTAKQTGSTFMAMGAGMGLAMEEASDMAIAMTGLSADMASFYNISQDVASTALKSIFTGETETLKQFGIVMTETNLQEYAYAQGIHKSIREMTQAEKVQLRYKYVMDQTKLAQGDFAKTSDNWANQTRILAEQWKQFITLLGNGVLQAVTPVIRALNDVMSNLISLTQKVADALGWTLPESTDTTPLEELAEATDKVTTATQKSTKANKDANKQAKKNLGTYDKLNVEEEKIKKATTPDVSTGGGGGGKKSTPAPTIDTKGSEKSASKLQGILDKLKKKFKELKGLFLQGFKLGVGDTSVFDDIKGNLSLIKESLAGIVTDKGVVNAANNWANSWAFALGEVAGSVTSIGGTIADNLTGGISLFLQEHSPDIKDDIISLFDISGEIGGIIGRLSVAIADIFEVFRSPEAIQSTASIFTVLYESGMNALLIAEKLGRDVLGALVQPILDNKDDIKSTLQGIIDFISSILTTFSEFVTHTWDSIQSLYDEHIKPLIDSLGAGFSEWMNVFLTTYQETVQPILEEISTRFDELMNETVQPAVDNLIEYFGSFIDLLKLLWEKVLVPLGSFLIKTLIPIFMVQLKKAIFVAMDTFKLLVSQINVVLTVFKGICKLIKAVAEGDWNKAWQIVKDTAGETMDAVVEVFKNAWKLIKDIFAPTAAFFGGVWSGIKACFKGVASWFQTTFAKAWEAVKKVFTAGGVVFKGIKEGIADALGTVIKGLCDGINALIVQPFENLNSIISILKSNKMTGKFFDKLQPFAIPQIDTSKIPHLATGAVIPPNKQFLAMLGDQKQGTNIETPLDTMIEAFTTALDKRGGSANAPIILQLNGRQIAKVVWDEDEKRYKQTGQYREHFV